MTKRFFLAGIILLLAFALRFYKIGQIPATLYGDEQAFAWNAYNILKTGTDEYGTPYPLQFRSFNDYKAPIPVYLLVPFFKLFGMNPWSIRLPVSIASILTVFIFYLFCRSLLKEKISLLSIFLFAISPWHVHLSRGYFEATISLLFFMSGIYFYFKSRNKINNLILSSLFFAASLYSYFTPRILLPLFIPFLLLCGYKYFFTYEKRQVLKHFTVFLFLLFILSLPQLFLTFFDRGMSRFNKLNESMNANISGSVNLERNSSNLPVSIRPLFHNKISVWLRLVKNNYLEHFSVNFWYIYGDNSLRYFLGNMGMFYLFEFPFLIIGYLSLYKRNKPLTIFLTGWLLLAPIPASIVGRSFAVRSLAMLPAPFIFVASGIYYSLGLFGQNRKKIFISGILTVAVIYFSQVLIRYYLEYPVYAATWWGWENKAALDFALKEEHLYDQIFISDYYTGAPLSFAVYKNIDPQKFRYAVNNPVVMADNRRLIKLGKYYFGSLDLDGSRIGQNLIPPKSLYIGRPEEAESNEVIKAPVDGRIIFKIFKTN